MSTPNDFPATLFHPHIQGVTQTVNSAEEKAEWEASGWVADAPDYGTSDVEVQIVHADTAETPAATSAGAKPTAKTRK